MRRRFVKMQGLGNDFVVFDATATPFSAERGQLRRIADRRFGVGCDQILVVEPGSGGADFGYRIFNADGGEVAQCGNGARCFARFVRDEGLIDKDRVAARTASRTLVLELLKDGQVRVDMGVPTLAPEDIPFQPAHEMNTGNRYRLDLAEGRAVEITAVGLGNPHAVMEVADIDSAPVQELGPFIEHHQGFPERVNAGFMQVIDEGHIRVRVFERGTGETMSCGSGACAAVVAGRLAGWLNQSVEAILTGGRLRIDWFGPGERLWMTGPAERVFEGALEI